MRAKRREAIRTISINNLPQFTHAITPEVRNDARLLKWIQLPYALRYVDLFCARACVEQ